MTLPPFNQYVDKRSPIIVDRNGMKISSIVHIKCICVWRHTHALRFFIPICIMEYYARPFFICFDAFGASNTVLASSKHVCGIVHAQRFFSWSLRNEVCNAYEHAK
jgi:hypothetical protein